MIKFIVIKLFHRFTDDAQYIIGFCAIFDFYFGVLCKNRLANVYRKTIFFAHKKSLKKINTTRVLIFPFVVIALKVYFIFETSQY